MRTPEQIIGLYATRRKDYMGLHQQMETIRRVYTGEASVDLPDMDKVEQAYVPNLLQTGIDQMAGRIASTTPVANFTTDGKTRRAERKAATRQRVVTGWWAVDRIPAKNKTRARHLLAYSQAPATVVYSTKLDRPTWAVRNPAMCFPSSDLIPGVVTPNDVIFAYSRTWGWLKANGYDAAAKILPPGATGDNKLTLVEYHDPEQTTLLAYAEPTNQATWLNSGAWVVLQHMPNPIGITPATVPTRISLETSGQFDGMVGMYYMQAKLMALEVLAVERGIFPDTYLEGRSGETPKFVAGPYDGRSGEVNIVSGGTIKDHNTQPGYVTNQTIDRLERAQRLTAGVPSEFGGESPSNVRTGRRGDSVLSATIDFPVAEAQEVLAMALHDEDIAAIKLARHYNGMAPKTIYVGSGNTRESITYVPATVFDDDCDHTVDYPINGTDMNALMIGLGQRVGLGTMSKRTAAELDPYIASAETEHDQTVAEGLEQALLSGIQQQAASGAIPPVVLSRIMTLVRTDRMELPEAIEKATAEAAERQAAEAEAAQGAPGQPGDAAALAGLAGEQSPIPGASPGQEDLASLMASLRLPAMTVKPLQGVAQGAQ